MDRISDTACGRYAPPEAPGGAPGPGRTTRATGSAARSDTARRQRAAFGENLHVVERASEHQGIPLGFRTIAFELGILGTVCLRAA